MRRSATRTSDTPSRRKTRCAARQRQVALRLRRWRRGRKLRASARRRISSPPSTRRRHCRLHPCSRPFHRPPTMRRLRQLRRRRPLLRTSRPPLPLRPSPTSPPSRASKRRRLSAAAAPIMPPSIRATFTVSILEHSKSRYERALAHRVAKICRAHTSHPLCYKPINRKKRRAT